MNRALEGAHAECVGARVEPATDEVEEKRHWMLVAPTLPDLHRAATEAEARFLLDGLRSPRAAADGEAARMHSRLRTEGIVVTRVPPSE